MIIYCSKKLEEFLGVSPSEIIPIENVLLGEWNAHLFILGRKKCLIFMNNRSCFSILLLNVQKKNLKKIGLVFKERLNLQLEQDFNLTEEQKIKLGIDLGEIVFTKSNNDRKIIGTINHHVEVLKYVNFENWDEIQVTSYINSLLIGTKIASVTKRQSTFFKPNEVMEEWINGI